MDEQYHKWGNENCVYMCPVYTPNRSHLTLIVISSNTSAYIKLQGHIASSFLFWGKKDSKYCTFRNLTQPSTLYNCETCLRPGVLCRTRKDFSGHHYFNYTLCYNRNSICAEALGWSERLLPIQSCIMPVVLKRAPQSPIRSSWDLESWKTGEGQPPGREKEKNLSKPPAK